MRDEVTLSIGRRGAALLIKQLRPALFQVGAEDRQYLVGVMTKLQEFLDKPATVHLKLKYTILKDDQGQGK